MPAYSQRKRKIAKKSTRRSKKRLSRRIKTRRGGGKIDIKGLQKSFEEFLGESERYAARDLTATNFFDEYNNKDHNYIITSIIEKHNKNEFESRNILLHELKKQLDHDDDGVGTNQAFIKFLVDFEEGKIQPKPQP